MQPRNTYTYLHELSYKNPSKNGKQNPYGDPVMEYTFVPKGQLFLLTSTTTLQSIEDQRYEAYEQTLSYGYFLVNYQHKL